MNIFSVFIYWILILKSRLSVILRSRLSVISWIWYQRHQQYKKELINWTSSSLKHLYIKEHYQGGGKQLTEREKLFASYISDKGLISRMYKEILSCNNKKKPQITLFKIDWGRGMGGTSLPTQWLRPCLPMEGAQVLSLVGELRSHMPLSVVNK